MTRGQSSAGGAATAAGTTFQENVAAYFSVLILAEQDSTPPASLASNVVLEGVMAESIQPIDDLKVRTSSNGQLFIQAKTTLILSEADDVFASVAEQFVRQYRAGISTLRTPTRALNPESDRFVLAVSESASAKARNTLRDCLERLRSAQTAADRSETIAAFSSESSDVLFAISSQLRRAWLKNVGTNASEDEISSILRLVHVLVFDFGPDGETLTRAKDYLRTSVLLHPPDAEAAWNTLIAVCRGFAPTRSGGDRLYFRSELERSGIPLKTTPSFSADVQSLRNYTSGRVVRLEQLSVLEFRGQKLKINRPAVAELDAFSVSGSVLIIGSPGAGKSGCLYDLVSRQIKAERDVVLVAVDRLSADSDAQLAAELGVSKGRSLVDILENWPGNGPAMLAIDALDAARSEFGLSTILELFRELKVRAPRWHIVASMREFDLRNSREIQSIFAGAPHPTRHHPHFPNVRHVLVEELSESEILQLNEQNQQLGNVIQSTQPVFRDRILPNLFNLRLLCELADANTSASSIAGIHSQLELLDLYWSERIIKGDNDGYQQALINVVVEKMVEDRLLNVSTADLGHVERASSGLKRLLSNRVLIEDALPRLAGSSTRISFAHNILFDYAVARVKLQELPDTVIEWLATPSNQDLLLAIRPSLVMGFLRLWYQLGQVNRERFWERAVAFHSSQTMRLIGKILAGTVAADSYQTYEDVRWLVDKIGNDNKSPYLAVLQYTVLAAITKHRDNPQLFLISGPGAPEWFWLADELSRRPMENTWWLVRNLISHLERKTSELTALQLQQAGRASRNLLVFGLANERASGAVRSAIDVVCRTIASDSAASISVLSICLQPEQIAKNGHHSLGDIAEHLPALAKADGSFVLRLVDAIFAATASRDEQVPMGGRILSLTFNKHDLFAMARRHVAGSVEAIMRVDPKVATLVVIRVMEQTFVKEHAKYANPTQFFPFTVQGHEATIAPDASYIWAVGSHHVHDEWRITLNAFQKSLSEVAMASGGNEVIHELLILLATENRLPVVWNALLEVAATLPRTLGVVVKELLWAIPILERPETRVAAGSLISAVYEYLTAIDRERIEHAILAIPVEGEPGIVKIGHELRDQLLGCIPANLIETQEAKNRLEELIAEGGPPANRPAFELGEWTTLSDVDDLKRRGIPIEEPAHKAFYELLQKVKNFRPKDRQKALTIDELDAFRPVFQSFIYEIVRAESRGIDQQLRSDAEGELFECCVRVVQMPAFTSAHPLFAIVRSQLLRASNSPIPEYSTDDDEKWDSQNPSWGSPAARILAAEGLTILGARRETTDGEIVESVLRLFQDPVAAVRFQIVTRLTLFWDLDRNLMWRLAEEIVKHEQRIAILTFFVNNFLFAMPRSEIERTTAMIETIYKTNWTREHAEDLRSRCAVYFLRRAVWDQSTQDIQRLKDFASSPLKFKPELFQIVGACRALLRDDARTTENTSGTQGREFAVSYLRHLLNSIRQERHLLKKDSSQDGREWSKESLEQLRDLHHLADSVANQVYFASGAFDAKRSGTTPQEDSAPMSTDRLREFATEVDPLLESLAQIEIVDVAYELLQILQYLVPVAPKRIFMLLATSVRQAKTDGIQYESMASDLVVEIVERYLAEYRNLFREDPEVRTALLDVLDTFVEAGWPRATALTYRLDEVFR